MEGISQVQVVTSQPQKRSNKKGLIAVGLAGTAGVASGLYANKFAKNTIEEATRAADETLIRKKLADFYYEGKPVPECFKKFFETAVKDSVEVAESRLKHVKEIFKGAGVKTGAIAALGTLAIVGIANAVVSLFSSDKK
jgi:hypothetical protein